MECPKCHSVIKDNQTVCPKCHKVLLLECPNCHSLEDTAVCSKCGYSILVKCSKCTTVNPVENQTCSKCRFPLNTSLAYQECESDEFASVIIKFDALRSIRRVLKSQELYTKFFYKLKNLLMAQVKGVDGKFIIYGDTFVMNLSKELSLATSSAKAVRLALKIVNAFTELNVKVQEEFSTPLKLNITIVRKSAEDLQQLGTYENNVKLLTVNKQQKKYLKGMQVVLDQFISDEVSKEYKTDSLYSTEENGKTLMFYELVLGSYVLPPSEKESDVPVIVNKQEIVRASQKKQKDMYSFKVFDINAKCKFERVASSSLFENLSSLDFDKRDKIITIRSEEKNQVCTSSLNKFFEDRDYKVLNVTCTEKMNYTPWGIFSEIFKEYFGLAFHNRLNNSSKVSEADLNRHRELFNLINNIPAKSMTPEDGRFAYMEYWTKFLSGLDQTVIILEGFENADDTTIQTLELYFDKFKRIRPVFIFVTSKDVAVHSKIKGLLRTDCYTEFTLMDSPLESCLEFLKSDGTDFIQSFYFEKIKENFDGSLLYFENVVQYLLETGVLIDFDNKLLIKGKKSVIVPTNIHGLYKARAKTLNKNQDLSLMVAYAAILGARVDFATFKLLGVKDVEKNAKSLAETGLAYVRNDIVYLNNYNIIAPVIEGGLKKEASEFVYKNILAQLGKGLDSTTTFNLMGKLCFYKEEYLTLWKNSEFAIKTGDYDAYLKNCLGFLSLVEYIGSDIADEIIEENKKAVYNNILLSLYSYSPAKIYFIENMLLMDAIREDDNSKIVKLSNLMLQGALISSNYTDALGLLHNILSRMPHPTMLVDGEVNAKFLLLSLVNIEILYNIGDFRSCIDIANEILEVLTPGILEKVKPASFSLNLFITHILETFRLVGFAKLFLLDDDLEEFFEKVKTSLNADLPEKDCIQAVKDYLAGKVYSTGNIENYSACSKVIFLILQEFADLKGDYKRFAQNIYQAKLLASDIKVRELELFCDLLIAYSYSKIGISQKAESIYKDINEKAEKSAIFNILVLGKYLISKLKLETDAVEEALLLINDSLALIQKQNNQSKILYVLFEKLYIDIVKQKELSAVDLESEEQKLTDYSDSLKYLLG